MEKEFVPPTESLELKELGFNEPCFGYYVDGELRGVNLGLEELGGVKPYYKRFGFHTICNSDINNTEKSVVTAPTFSQSFRFFREKYNLVIVIKPIDDKRLELGYNLTKNGLIIQACTTYENAELFSVRNLIKIVKQGGNK